VPLDRPLWYLLYSVLVLAAWLVARRDRSHVPLALFVTWMPLADVLRKPILLFNQGVVHPLSGTHLVAWYLEAALVLSWSFFFLALALHYFTRLTPRLALGALLFTWLACLHPTVRGDILAVYRLVAVFTMAAVWVCFARALLRGDIEPQLAHLVILFYNAGDLASVLVPWMGNFSAHWDIMRVVTIVVLLASIAAHLWWLRRRRRTGVA
jgi:hypothetical protein